MDYLYWFLLVVLLSVYIRMKRIESELSALKGENHWMKCHIREVEKWCAYDSPEIGFAMLYLQEPETSIESFRRKLRSGEFTFDNYRKAVK